MLYRVTKTLIGACAACVLGFSGAANAQDAETNSISWSASLTGATEYIWRGVEQSAGDPAVFAAVSASYGNFYAGAGIENVDFAGIDTEYDFWVGYAAPIANGTTFDIGLVRYGYLDVPFGLDLDTVELKLALSHDFGGFSAGITAMITDDFFATEASAQHIEVNASTPVSENWTISGSVGHQMLDNSASNYTHWNIGASRSVADNVTLDIRYIDTDADYLGGAADERIVASFSVAF
jgi:uncharacterized protein (TIGR02001 family)